MSSHFTSSQQMRQFPMSSRFQADVAHRALKDSADWCHAHFDLGSNCATVARAGYACARTQAHAAGFTWFSHGRNRACGRLAAAARARLGSRLRSNMAQLRLLAALPHQHLPASYSSDEIRLATQYKMLQHDLNYDMHIRLHCAHDYTMIDLC